MKILGFTEINSKIILEEHYLKIKMLLADKKKQKNISEYIIFLYQTEDLIRVYNFDIGLIENHVIKYFPVSGEEKKKNLDWYQE
ncbi:MAG: DUF4924 family protein, partial [Bacteroidota bacterium]|nr:DUF4924 family protein [Bacteroidota bacterium]